MLSVKPGGGLATASKNLKGFTAAKRADKRMKIGEAVLLSLFIYQNVVCEVAYATHSTGLSGIRFSN